MPLYPEKGNAVFKVSTALAVGAGSLALASVAESGPINHINQKTAKRNELFIDHAKQLRLLDGKVSLILKAEQKYKPIHRVPHNGPSHNATSPYDIRFSPQVEAELEILRNCESGGNYGINTGNSFYGAYQIMYSTWRALGLRGYPNQAPPRVQDAAIVKNTEISTGGLSTQNPGCQEKEHLPYTFSSTPAQKAELIHLADEVLLSYG